VCREQAAGSEPREDHLEELLVVRLPRVQEHKIKRARQLGDFLERIAVNHLYDIGQASQADVLRRFLRTLRVVLDRHNTSTRFSRAEA